MLNEYLENTGEGLLHACISSIEKMKMKIWKLCPQDAIREEGVRDV
jgi:hypothetical protein